MLGWVVLVVIMRAGGGMLSACRILCWVSQYV
jgi:hypothetical protein